MVRSEESSRMKTRLTGVEETLLLPLWARARETQRHDPIIEDSKAVELLRRIDYDFTRFDHDWKSQVAVAVRTRLLDDAVRDFLGRNPHALVVNLGSGLDSRFHRLDNETVQWYELDLPEVITWRRQYFKEHARYRFISASVMDTSWFKAIDRGDRPVLLIAEGLLMYFARHQVRSLLRHLVNAFPGAEMLLEVLAFGAIGMTHYHDTLWRFDAKLKWSLADSHELEHWDRRIKLLNEWCVLDHHAERWGWLGLVAHNPWFRVLYGERIAHLRFTTHHP